jgi:glycosyltransferase involved in cell wall biosynthesis
MTPPFSSAEVSGPSFEPRGPLSAASEPIHVVFSIDTMGVGGTEMNAVRTAEQLDSSRYRLTVVTLRGEGPLSERYRAVGIPIVRFPIHNLYGVATIKQSVRLARFLRDERVGIVHCHDQYSNVFTTLSARLANVPVVIASKRWLHSTLTYRIANGIGFRAATRVLANSESVATSLRRDDHLDSKRIVVIPNFVDDRAFRPPADGERERWRAELALDGDALVVGIIASLLPIKDHATLLRAVAQLADRFPKLRVVVVGEGPERERLAQLATALGIGEVVRFAGLRPQVPSFHYLFDVSVLCSVSEGFPNSLIEAMAAGRPIVATDVGGVRDAVRDGENGLLVPARDPAALASALGRLLADRDQRVTFGSAGERRARHEFHARVVVGALERLYDQLLSERRSSNAHVHA